MKKRNVDISKDTLLVDSIINNIPRIKRKVKFRYKYIPDYDCIISCKINGIPMYIECFRYKINVLGVSLKLNMYQQDRLKYNLSKIRKRRGYVYDKAFFLSYKYSVKNLDQLMDLIKIK